MWISSAHIYVHENIVEANSTPKNIKPKVPTNYYLAYFALSGERTWVATIIFRFHSLFTTLLKTLEVKILEGKWRWFNVFLFSIWLYSQRTNLIVEMYAHNEIPHYLQGVIANSCLGGGEDSKLETKWLPKSVWKCIINKVLNFINYLPMYEIIK